MQPVFRNHGTQVVLDRYVVCLKHVLTTLRACWSLNVLENVLLCLVHSIRVSSISEGRLYGSSKSSRWSLATCNLHVQNARVKVV